MTAREVGLNSSFAFLCAFKSCSTGTSTMLYAASCSNRLNQLVRHRAQARSEKAEIPVEFFIPILIALFHVITNFNILETMNRVVESSRKLVKRGSTAFEKRKDYICRMSTTNGSVGSESVGKMIPISELVVTQYGYRDDAGILEMEAYVKAGGEFNAKPLISLFSLDDGRLYIHDGHHRSMAIYLSGRSYLNPTEYAISPFTFKQLQTANFETGYVTPYDPRVEMRKSDFRIFKKTARQIYDDMTNPNRKNDALDYILKNRPLYTIPHRPYETIPEMVTHLGLLPSRQAKL